MKKIISILMVAVMVLGLLPVTSFATESDFNVIEPDTWYSILLPENPSTELENAANELQFFVEEITGVHLDILNDDGAMTADTEYISLGNTSVFSESGYSIEGLEAEASVVKTYSVSILLYGGSDVGVTYAVYELLEHWFDLKFYTPDCYTYTAKETVAFEELDLTSTPAVDYRTVGMYLTWYSGWTNLRRMRVSNTSEYMNGLGHSIANLLPPATYYAEHPEWYSNYANGQVDNWQVCLSNAEMRAQLIANVKAKLASNSSLKYFSVGQNDGDGFCTCDNCKALNLQYSVNADAYSGAWLAMVNEVAAACAEEYPDVIFYMLAYTNRTDAAPTKNITANDNVGVMYAPIDGQRTTSYFNGTGEYSYSNGRVTKNINAWTQLTDHFMMWSYAAQFGDAMVPVNIYDSLAANAQGYVAKDVEVVFEEAYKTVLPNFETMRNYLTAKALYDGNIDTFAEVDAFISAYYGPAASAMESYFDSFLANLRAFESKGDYYKSFNAAQFLNGDKYYSPAIIADNYSKTYVDSCKAYFDTAYSALSQAYATDSAEYATYKERIDLEYLGVLYLYLELYADQLTQEQGAEMAQQVFNIVNTSDVTIISGDKINAWRAQFNVVPDGIDYTFFQDKIFDDTSKNRECLYRSFTGEVGGKNINGVKITSDDYQPHFHFTEDAIAMIQAYAEKNGYDMLKINAYAILTDNSFVINKQLYVTSAWKSLNVPVAELSTAFDFWSQSQGATEIYMTFEFYTAPVIDASSFTNVAPDGTSYNITISDYEGTLLDVPFRGIYAASNAYQPSFYFKESAITEIKAYAEANNYDTLRMYVCVTGSGYNLVLNSKVWGVNSAWRSLDIPVADLTTSFRFKSTGDSSKLTRGYLYFEFIHTHSYESVVTAPTCTEQGYTTHTCACGESYVDTYVAATHSYEDGICAACGAVEPIIKPSSFAAMDSSKPYSFENYTGTVAGVDITGIKATSSAYQPKFAFTADAISQIQAYAEKNGYDMLKINAYAIVKDNGFFVNGVYMAKDQWRTTNIAIADLTTSVAFYSQSTGTTEAYLTFEFYTAPVISASSFTNVAPDGTSYSITISDYEGTLLDVPFTGIYAASSAYQPSFYFKESAITKIQAYAAANNYDTLRMYVCVTGSGYNLVLNSKVWGVNSAWRSLDIPVADLTTSFRFKSTGDSSKLTRGYLYFEFIHTHSYESVVTAPTCTERGYTTHTCVCGDSYVDTYVAATHSYENGTCSVCGTAEPFIKASFFAAMDSGKPYGFANYTGMVADVAVTGIKATSSAYQPKFAFTADAISQIQAYAEKNGYDMLKINAYAIVKDNGFFVNGVYMAKDQWRTTNIAIADLTTSVAFYSQSTDTTEVYLTFEFYTAPVISASSFTNVAPNGNTSAITISDYTGAQLDVEFTGIKASSGAVYQPTFYFTEEGIAKIQAYAKKNNYNNLRIYVCVSGSGYNLVLNNKAWGVNSEWRYLDVAIADLTTSFYFRSTNSNAATNAYLRFEFTNEEVITNTSFAGNFTFAQYEGVVSGKEFKGIKAVGNGVYQPKLWFNDAAITAIKKNAELLGYDALKINVCALLTNNSLLVDKMFYVGDTWKTITVSVEDLSTSLIFHSLSEGTSEIYMSFEFCNMTDYVEGYNVSLGDDIGVNFCLNMTEEEKSSAKIKVNIAGKLQPEIAASALTVKDGAPVLSVNVAAAQMTDIISVGYANGSDFVLIGKYTVREYADYILANDYNDETKNLVKAMLVYGGAAQTYFDYNTGVGANLDIKVEMQTVPTETEAMAVNGAVDGLSFYGASMLFTSKNTVRYYFTLADGADIASYTFTSNGQPLTAIEKDGMYYVEVADINPQDLDDAVEVAVTCADQTLTVAYSPMNYIVRMYNKETTSDNLKALLAAMYTYHVAAEVLYPDAQ